MVDERFYNPNWLLLLRLLILAVSILDKRRGAFTCFAVMVCSDWRGRGVVVLEAPSLNLGYRRWPVRRWLVISSPVAWELPSTELSMNGWADGAAKTFNPCGGQKFRYFLRLDDPR